MPTGKLVLNKINQLAQYTVEVGVHPEENRAITLREAALLQGFPRSYKFKMSKGRYPVAQLIGNAFPPKFAEHHARSLYLNLEEGLHTVFSSETRLNS